MRFEVPDHLAATCSRIFVLTLTCLVLTAEAGPVEFDLLRAGPGNFRLTGTFTFDESQLGQAISEGDLLSFRMEGFNGSTSLGTFSGTPTEFDFNSASGSFDHPLSWNVTGPGIGYRTTTSSIGGSTSINDDLLSNGAVVPGASRSFMFEPSVRATQAPPTGQLPLHIYTLRMPPGSCPHPNPSLPGCINSGDTLPVGASLFFTFAIFDTGSTSVAINSAGSGGLLGDSDLLNLCRSAGNCSAPGPDPFLPQSLDLRVWGLGAVDPVTLGAPLDSPEAETRGLRMRTFSGPTLLGGPLTARTVAMIDYTSEVERVFNFGTPFTVWSPDIKFFNSRIGAQLPILALEFELERVGSFGSSPSDGASIGPRFLMKNIVITNGASSIGDTAQQFLYDTGNTVTQITHATAQALGIDPDNDTPAHVRRINTVSGSVDVKGFIVDELTITSVFGDPFTLQSPLIYVRPLTSNLGGVDVNLGSDIFRDTRIVFDGPADRIWIPRENYPGPQQFVDNGDGTITDPTKDLMWLQDAGYSATTNQGPNANGKMPWNDAMAWAAGLQFVGYDDWRLPATLEPDPDCMASPISGVSTKKNCRGAEMGYLYWGQGITAVTSGPFLNVPPAEFNWSSTLHSSGSLAWVHSFRHGEQGAGNMGPGILLPAWPVRDVLPTDTNPGSDVEVAPASGLRLVFETVDAGGATTVKVNTVNPVNDPANFQLLGSFYNIRTTADQSGDITVCIAYPPGTDTSTLELLRWSGTTWIPLSNARIDPSQMTICAETPSLSWFVVGVQQRRGWIWWGLLFLLALIAGG